MLVPPDSIWNIIIWLCYWSWLSFSGYFLMLLFGVLVHRWPLGVTVNTTPQAWTANAAMISSVTCPGGPQRRAKPTPASVRPHPNIHKVGADSGNSARGQMLGKPVKCNLKQPSVFCPSGCECNSHARRCRFDPAVYEASGRRSGGVCEGCMHHTTGPKCDRCAPGYQPNPRSKMDRPDACIRKWFTGP